MIIAELISEGNMLKISTIIASVAALGMMAGVGTANAAPATGIKNVVLVHGGFVDGSGWEGVYKILAKDGYHVTVVQNPTISLTDDVAVTKRALAKQDGPAVLVGHSYGGAVITESGTDPKVKALVYIAAFAPDAGESVSALLSKPTPGYAAPPILPPVDGYLFLDRAKYASAFAADVKPAEAAFMADSQVPWNVDCLNGKITVPAWKSKPSWYLLTKDDHMIPPPLQAMMSKRAGATVTETAGSHAIYVSNPKVVADIIEKAATEAK
jgi:pimeloyl-ACP methyl ester carboxylesterase